VITERALSPPPEHGRSELTRTSGTLRPLVFEPGTTAQAQAYQAVREALMAGRLRPGEEVSLRQAAAALGISVTPVREALRRVESEGGLVAHGGNRVLRVPFISAKEVAEIRQIRVELEGMATASAAQKVTHRQMRLISNACNLMAAAAAENDADRYLEHNWRFHALIYRAADMPILLGLIEGLWLRIGSVIRLALRDPAHFKKTMACHRAAEAALRAGDAEAARAAITRDITDAAADLAEVLEKAEFPNGDQSA
jgi:DNA-binding GntR family transcriptional regulator